MDNLNIANINNIIIKRQIILIAIQPCVFKSSTVKPFEVLPTYNIMFLYLNIYVDLFLLF